MRWVGGTEAQYGPGRQPTNRRLITIAEVLPKE